MGGEQAPKHTNRLAKEKSPYLLQHAHNPVDWYPWGEEAFERAKAEDKPVFLSIGYSTCHWCHVMEHESFENEEVAKFMNDHFISIKVDREERPDVDGIYMSYVQLKTGRGGWPLSVWLTPEEIPFFGGTYYPMPRRMGMPSFLDMLTRISEIWKTKREEIEKDALKIAEALEKHTERSEAGEVNAAVLDIAYADLKASFDPAYGGFGRAPKFPRSMELSFMMRYYRRTSNAEALPMIEKTLEMMYRGGMYDHLGGGFHRYSTDARWLVPHFEKMLYDNALLARAYLEAYQLTGKELYARIAREILDYVLRDMLAPSGGFYSAEDADSAEDVDSKKEEGVFYVWTPAELVEILGKKDGELIKSYYGVTKTGNFETTGKSILHLPLPPEEFPAKAGMEEGAWLEILERSKKKLFEVRGKRIRPYLDDKIITAWNGLMISSMAFAYEVLGDDRYLDAGKRAADFALERLVKDGRLLRRHRDGESGIHGFIDDYAFFSAALLDLYQATWDDRYFREAIRLTDEMVRLFWDDKGGGFYFAGSDAEELIARPKEVYDGALPSGNSVAALNLLRLGEWTSDKKWIERGENTIKAFGAQIAQHPRGYPQSLCAVDFLLGKPKEIVLAGPPGDPGLAALLDTIHKRFIPNKVIALVPTGEGAASLLTLMPMLKDRGMLGGKATAYVCENYACKLPTSDPAELAKQLDE
ncbi:MAG: thioredoxin domain-containing protein [Planctomycetota bacterium]|nr:thioredoxin domain-containing protein [Planctomycetota bacterium]